MKQQINLYQPIFRKQKVVFSARSIAWLALGFVAVLLLWTILLNYRIGHLEAQHQRQVEAENTAVEQLANLRETLPPSEPDPGLEREITRLEQRRRNLVATLEALEDRLPATRINLRRRLEALARGKPRGLWLTGVELGDDADRLTIHGRALSGRLVPAYLEALSDEPALAGLAFRRIRVRAGDDDAPGIEFVVSTRPEESS